MYKSNHTQSSLRKREIDLSNNLTICIAGKNDIAVNALKYLTSKYDQYSICFIPNPTDDGLDGWQPSLKKLGCELGVKEAKLEELYEIEGLLFLSLEFSEIIKTDAFKTKNLFNIHFSLLPKYRGMYTSTLPLLYGENESGVTLHKIDDGIDTGEIIDQIKFNIGADDTARDLYFKYLENSFLLLKNNLDKLIIGSFLAKPQTSTNATYFSKKTIDYKNIRINFSKNAFEVKNQFRAFTFREYQMPIFENWEIYKTEILNNRSELKPGTKIFESEVFFIVSTIDYDLKLFKDYYKLFWQICELGDHSKLNSVVSKITNINLINAKGWNAIIIATYHGHLDIVKRLIDLGADINSKNKVGTTLLMYAFSYYQRSKDPTIFQTLAELGSDILSVDRFGKDLKRYIIENKCDELLKHLD
jgi:methionyl-tRNA formyltransferase